MPTYNVSKKRGKSKIKISDKREAAMNKIIDSYSEDLDVKMAVIQDLEVEGRLNRVRAARYLKILRFKLQEIIEERKNLKNQTSENPTSQRSSRLEIVECWASQRPNFWRTP